MAPGWRPSGWLKMICAAPLAIPCKMDSGEECSNAACSNCCGSANPPTKIATLAVALCPPRRKGLRSLHALETYNPHSATSAQQSNVRHR